MSLIKKPSELEVKLTLTALIYGQPGTGKSSLCCSAPKPVLFDFDGGVCRINGAHQVDTVQVRSWEEVLEALDEVEKSRSYETIIIDTVGKMLAYMEEFIKRTNPKMKQHDGSLSLKGFGMRKQMFIDFIKRTALMGKNVIFVAHEIEQKRGDETVIRPEVSGSSGNDLVKELDLVGYMEMYGNKRTISFTPCEKYYAKNTCNMPGVIEVPCLIDAEGKATITNDFMCKVIANFHQRLETNKEMTAQYEALVCVIEENIDNIKSASDANRFVEWIKGVSHIYNSRVVALEKLQSKVTALHIEYDNLNKTYRDAGTAA